MSLVGTNPASAQTVDVYQGQVVSSVRIESAGQPIKDAQVASLVLTQPGSLLDPSTVRQSIFHLINVGRFDDVRVSVEPAAGGLTLVYDLIPRRRIARVAFAGTLGVPESELNQVIRARFTSAAPITRVDDAERALRSFYRDHGFFDLKMMIRVDPDEHPETATLVFDITAGPRAVLGTIESAGTLHAPEQQMLDRLQLRSGRPYDGPALQRRIDEEVRRLKAEGRYQAIITSSLAPRENGAIVDVLLNVEPGPLVSLVFEGDEVPRPVREDLVPVEREGSVDEDLLEDSQRRLEKHFHDQGYWGAVVRYNRAPHDDRLEIVFTVKRGRLYRVADVTFVGNSALSFGELRPLIGLKEHDPFVESALDRDEEALRQHYRRLGFVSATVTFSLEETSAPSGRAEEDVVWVRPTVVITEGSRTLVGTVAFEGVSGIDDATLQDTARLRSGDPFSQQALVTARDALLELYRDRGYHSARVDVVITPHQEIGQADVTFRANEGPRVFIGRVIVSGNSRISVETIERELLIKPGQPLSLPDLLDSRRRLVALGLFRRVQITDVGQPGEATRDVVVQVEESAATTVGYGGGVEAGQRLVAQGGDLPPEEKLEFAWRAFFEVGRRNLFGKNRSVNLFTRVSLRRKNPSPNDPLEAGEQPQFGLNEYRVIGSFREPRVFEWRANGQVSGFVEQTIRPSFSFRRRGAQAELSRPLTERVNLVTRYGYDNTQLFDEQISPEDAPLIDRLFPRVRLSMLSAAVLRDTRDDPLDPVSGTQVSFDQTFAIEALGSEVGFGKTFMQGFIYRRLHSSRRIVAAGGVRLGLARGYAREVTSSDGSGTEVVTDLPASERFFAGGANTVRGFSLDRLGDELTLDKDGFPTGGNAMIVLNAELRFPIWRSLGAAVFYDMGNVFERASQFNLGDLRGSPGFGVRYRSPLGPIRVDLGFKLDRLVFDNGQRERLTALHISIGQAF